MHVFHALLAIGAISARTAIGPSSRRQVLARAFAIVAAPAVTALPLARALAADEPSGGGQLSDAVVSKLRDAYDALDRGAPERAEPLLSECIDAWRAARQPNAELASLFRLRASARLQLADQAAAVADLNTALELATTSGEAGERLQILQLRAAAFEATGAWRLAEADLGALLAEEAGEIGGKNPFLRTRRARARQQLADWRGAASDLADAEEQLEVIGDRIRALLASCALALAQYGAGDSDESLRTIARVFASYTKPGSNNPDDLPLLEDLSRREAELHLVLAAHYGGGPTALADGRDADAAAAEWGVGCLRLGVYDEQLRLRRTEEDRRRISPSALELVTRSLARLSGLAPDSPYVTQIPGEGYWCARRPRVARSSVFPRFILLAGAAIRGPARPHAR
jgi:hypothetical protein